jgi:hypothetical protein
VRIARRRADPLLVDRDDDVHRGYGIGDNVVFVIDLSQSPKSLLAVILTRVFFCYNSVLKNQGCVSKIDASFLDVAKPFFFVPYAFEIHGHSFIEKRPPATPIINMVYTNVYSCQVCFRSFRFKIGKGCIDRGGEVPGGGAAAPPKPLKACDLSGLG